MRRPRVSGATLAAAALAVVLGGCAHRDRGEEDASTSGANAAEPYTITDPAIAQDDARRIVRQRALASLLDEVREREDAAIRSALMAQADAWSRGDLVGFMAGYARGDEVRFASGGQVTSGWLATLESYERRYPDTAAMGVLTFSELDVDLLAPDAAVVFGRWRLLREGDAPSGLFTLVMRKIGDGWVIVHDHTSAAE